VYISLDGPEVLVYSGNDDGPLWKYFCEDVAIGVGVTNEEVYVLEATGRLVKMRLVNGELLDSEELSIYPTGLLISDDEYIAVIGNENLFVRPPGGEPMAVAISGVSALAFGPTGGSLGLGTDTGHFCAVDTATGGAWGSVELGGPITGVSWSAQQYWLVTTGHEVHTISGDGGQVMETMDIGVPINGIACSLDGSVVAVVTEETHIRVFEWLNKSQAGTIWFQREVQTIEFGPSSWLGIGHDDGDGNRVDLFTGQMTRTQAHEGRGQTAWPMQVEINSALLRGSSTSIRAGSAPLAVQVRSEAIEEKKSSRMIWVVVALLVGIAICSSVGMLLCGVSFLPKGPKYYFGF